MTKKKILFISHLYPSSVEPGRALFNRQLMQAMGEQADVRVIAPYFWFPGKTVLPAQETLDGLEVLHPRIWYVPGLLIHKHWMFYRRAVRSCFVKMLEEFKPNHVILGFLYPDVVAMGALCREMGVDYSVRVNGSDFYLRIRQDKFRGMVRDELMKAPRIFCPGEAMKEAMVAEGVDEGKIVAFDNGVDGELFRYRTADGVREKNLPAPHKAGSSTDLHPRTHRGPMDPEGRFSQIKDKRIVLYVGNLVHIKGPDVLIDTFAKLVELEKSPQKLTSNTLSSHRHDYQLIVIGEGKERRRLEQQAERLGIADRVVFLGSRPHDEVALWMNVADCLCLSSRSEGMPNVVIEALTSGLPVVATDVGECRRILMDEPNSRIAPGGESGKLAKALNALLNVDLDRRSMAEKYQDSYSWARGAELILDEIDAVR